MPRRAVITAPQPFPGQELLRVAELPSDKITVAATDAVSNESRALIDASAITQSLQKADSQKCVASGQ